MAKKRTATFLGPNKGLSIIGDHCYAISSAAALTAATGEETRLEFQTGSIYIVGTVNALNGDLSGDNWIMRTYYNNILILDDKIKNSAAGHNDTFHVIPIIIPPHTTVKVTMQVEADSDSVSAQIIGRVYDA